MLFLPGSVSMGCGGCDRSAEASVAHAQASQKAAAIGDGGGGVPLLRVGERREGGRRMDASHPGGGTVRHAPSMGIVVPPTVRMVVRTGWRSGGKALSWIARIATARSSVRAASPDRDSPSVRAGVTVNREHGPWGFPWASMGRTVRTSQTVVPHERRQTSPIAPGIRSIPRRASVSRRAVRRAVRTSSAAG